MSPPLGQLTFPSGAFDCWAYMTCNEAILSFMARISPDSLESATSSLLLVRAELWHYALQKVRQTDNTILCAIMHGISLSSPLPPSLPSPLPPPSSSLPPPPLPPPPLSPPPSPSCYLFSQLHDIGVLCGLMPSSNKLNHDKVLIKHISSGINPVPPSSIGKGACTHIHYAG